MIGLKDFGFLFKFDYDQTWIQNLAVLSHLVDPIREERKPDLSVQG
jgi:hypothetical protein